MIVTYNIHSILRIASNIKDNVINEIIPQVFASKDENISEPDLKIFIDNSEDKKKENKFFQYVGPLKFHFLRSGFSIVDLSGKTEILISSPRYRLFKKLREGIKRLIFEIIEIKLLQKEYSFIHSACLAYDKKAFLLIGLPETGKTLSTIYLVKNYNLKFMSDDMTIIGRDLTAYNYPVPFTIHPYHIKALNMKIPIISKIKLNVRWGLKKIPVLTKYIKEFKLPYNILFNKEQLKNSAKIQRIYLLEHGSENVEELDKSYALRKILYAGRMHRSIYEDFIMSYAFKNPDFDLDTLFETQRRLYFKLVENSECYLVKSRRKIYAKLIAKHLFHTD